MKHDISLWKDDLDSSFKVYHELMAHRIHDILLILSPYDAFIMEEDTSLSTRIINEYRGLNLSKPPRLTSVAVAGEALELVRYKKFDLVITLPQVGEMDCNTLGLKIKEICPHLPVILLGHNMKAIFPYLENEKRSGIDNFYIWSADPALLLALIKNIEDHHNVDRDTSLAMVRILILVEDSPLFKSLFLPLLYKEVVAQTQAVMNESLNEEHRLLKMRARPKILVAENYEVALQFYQTYKKFVFGIISDTRFPRNNSLDGSAGVELLSNIRNEIPDMPLLLISSEASNMKKAESVPASFIYKNSDTFAEEVHRFFLEHLGFGDFVFSLPEGGQIDRAANLHALEKKLATIPAESLLYHARNNHFSNWVMARSEIGLASLLHKKRLQKFKSADTLRLGLIRQIHALRRVREQGIVTHFSEHDFDADVMQFVKIGHGSMGGKALGLAFMASQLKKNSWLQEKYPRLDIAIPPTLVITTDGFHAFMRDNDLATDFKHKSDSEIAAIFLRASMPAWLENQIGTFLQQVHEPLSVRSSSLLEDALYRPLAGLFETYMLPNNADHATRLQQLVKAVKLVFASTFYAGPLAFYSEAEKHTTSPDSMAVIIQILAGRTYGDYLYPAISGMAKSYNYYPVGKMKAGDGIAQIALGFGKTVVEGEKCLLFSPRYPESLPQFTNVDDMLASSQQTFYALPLKRITTELDYKHSNLVQREINEAANEPPVQAVASTYSPEEHVVRDSFGKGHKIVTFAGILKHRMLPLADLLQDLLDLGYKGMSCDIEIEFAVDLDANAGKNRFHFLQIRPMAVGEDQYEVRIEQAEIDRSFCYSSKPL
ncbi:MAG: phosphoenolpyruvate synthase/pyruvate phosphate dikinase, partial [Deltaproteobacteria bacterium]|nr:phosphoenolpyruvate synthase/pyruvate phosphate dikinase [Deltaproteobacteria bacterium]